MKASGRIKVKIDGELLRSLPGASIDIGGVTREEKPNDQGTVDYVEKTKPAMVKAKLSHVGTTDLPRILAFTGGQVQYEADNGVTYLVPNAWTKEIGELADGEVEVTFGGDPAIKQ